MFGQMQDWPLTVDKVLEHARINHPETEVVTRTCAGPITRSNYATIYDRSKIVSEALVKRGFAAPDRIATLAFNSDMHMETWYGAMGLGMVLHTLNPRLHPQQLAWIINDAEDKALFFDVPMLPVIEAIVEHIPSVKMFVMYGSDAMLPQETKIPGLMSYDGFLDDMTGKNVVWGGFDERTACGLCYTSGTTGNPKGVLYSHRSNVLHTMMTLQKDAMCLGAEDTLLAIVPMFHANAWGLAFSGPAVGAKLVMPGPRFEGEAIHELLETEKIGCAAAVPTVWLMLMQYLAETGKKLPYLNRVLIGGAAVPEAVVRTFQDQYDVEVTHAWGMTETSPLGTIGSQLPQVKAMSPDEQVAYTLKQGRSVFGVELKAVGENGQELPRDGKSAGKIMVRGPAIAKAYWKNAGGDILDEDGWFDTGDVAHIDPLGYMQITDRAKDVIKSGGEWISSIDIENHAVSHPAVAVAGAIGLPHPKWDERPLLIVQLQPGQSATGEEILQSLVGKIAKWWMPDEVVFVDEIPLGATGKINKVKLREMFKDHTLPTA